eukprot:1142067-Pelagomonas_calceolata.AAC.1
MLHACCAVVGRAGDDGGPFRDGAAMLDQGQRLQRFTPHAQANVQGPQQPAPYTQVCVGLANSILVCVPMCSVTADSKGLEGSAAEACEAVQFSCLLRALAHRPCPRALVCVLVCSVTGDRKGLEGLAAEAREAGKHNVAFVGLFLLGRMQECVELLVEAGSCCSSWGRVAFARLPLCWAAGRRVCGAAGVSGGRSVCGAAGEGWGAQSCHVCGAAGGGGEDQGLIPVAVVAISAYLP